MPLQMRTLPQAAEELRCEDPDTAITLATLRLLVNRGEIPVVQIRNRRLVDMGTLKRVLAGESSSSPVRQNMQTEERGTMRKINEIGRFQNNATR